MAQVIFLGTAAALPTGDRSNTALAIPAEAGSSGLLVDTGGDIYPALCRAGLAQDALSDLFITHAHIDHIGGATQLRRLTGAPVWLNPRDRYLATTLESQAAWIGVPPPEAAVIDADLDEATRLSWEGHDMAVLETPGHTEGSVCLYLPEENKLFAGDTLFAGSIGRTDFPGGDWDAIQRSLHNTVLALPDATIVIPGHGPETTIGHERLFNPYLK